MNTLTKRHYFNQTPVHENNYFKIIKLAPNLQHLSEEVSLFLRNNIHINIVTIEKHKYTSVILVNLFFGIDKNLLSNPKIKVRVCHDVKVAEVISYHNQSRFQPDYHYPNQKMYHPDEKQQINSLLSEILDFCLQHKNTNPEEIVNSYPFLSN